MAVAVGTPVTGRPRAGPYRRLSRIRLVWGFLCQGCITPFLSCCVASFFARPAPRAFFRPDRIAVAHSDGHGRRFFSAAEGLSLTNASTAANCRDRVGARDDPRGACHWSRLAANHACIRLNPYRFDHEAVIRFYGQGSEAAGPFSQRHCSHSRMRIAATSDRHRLPRIQAQSGAEPCFCPFSSTLLLTPPASTRHRPVSHRS